MLQTFLRLIHRRIPRMTPAVKRPHPYKNAHARALVYTPAGALCHRARHRARGRGRCGRSLWQIFASFSKSPHRCAHRCGRCGPQTLGTGVRARTAVPNCFGVRTVRDPARDGVRTNFVRYRARDGVYTGARACAFHRGADTLERGTDKMSHPVGATVGALLHFSSL